MKEQDLLNIITDVNNIMEGIIETQQTQLQSILMIQDRIEKLEKEKK